MGPRPPAPPRGLVHAVVPVGAGPGPEPLKGQSPECLPVWSGERGWRPERTRARTEGSRRPPGLFPAVTTGPLGLESHMLGPRASKWRHISREKRGSA